MYRFFLCCFAPKNAGVVKPMPDRAFSIPLLCALCVEGSLCSGCMSLFLWCLCSFLPRLPCISELTGAPCFCPGLRCCCLQHRDLFITLLYCGVHCWGGSIPTYCRDCGGTPLSDLHQHSLNMFTTYLPHSLNMGQQMSASDQRTCIDVFKCMSL